MSSTNKIFLPFETLHRDFMCTDYCNGSSVMDIARFMCPPVSRHFQLVPIIAIITPSLLISAVKWTSNLTESPRYNLILSIWNFAYNTSKS